MRVERESEVLPSFRLMLHIKRAYKQMALIIHHVYESDD